MPIALLHPVIDPAFTVVFAGLPGAETLIRQPPPPPGAPLFGAAAWRQSLSQGAVVMVAALALAFWPHRDLDLHRSPVFSLLLLPSGTLVGLYSDRISGLSTEGPPLG